MIRIFILSILFFVALHAKEQTVKVQLKWKHQFQFAGFYMAKEKGFYKDKGLNVELFESTPNIRPLKKVLQNEVHFGVGNSEIILDYLENKPIVALMTAFQKSPLALMSLKSSKIKEPKDLKHKNISLSKNSIGNIAMTAMLRSNEVKADDFNQIPFTNNNLDKLVNKKIDAFSVYISSQPYLLKEKGIEYNLIYPDDYGFDFYSDIVFTSKKVLKNHPKLVKDFYEATKKGWEYAFFNVKESVDIVHKKYNSQNKSKAALLFEARTLQKISGMDENFGELKKDKIQNIINIIGLIHPKKYKNKDISAFIYNPNNLIFTPKEKAYLEQKKTLRVHNEMNWPPYNFNENGNPKGFSIDYMDLLAKKMGIKIHYVSGPRWDDFLEMISFEKLDVMLNIKKTASREDFLAFTDKYYTAFNGIFMRKDATPIKSLEELKGKTVSIVKGFYTQELLKKYYPEINLLLVDSTVDAMKAVLSNKAHATIGQKAVIEYLAMEHTLNDLKLASFIEDKRLQSELSMATAKENMLLRDILQKTKKSVTHEEMTQLKEKWFKLNIINHNIAFTQQQKNYLLNKEEIQLCSNIGNFPIDDIINKQHTGIMHEIIKEISKQIPIPIRMVPINSQKTLEKLIELRQCDILSVLSKDYNQYDAFYPTKEIFSNDLVVITKLNKAFISDITPLMNEKFIATSKAQFNAIKKYFPKIHLTLVEDINTAFKLIKKQEVFGLIDTRLSANYLIQKHGMGELKVAGKVCQECIFSYSIGILKDEPTLHHIVTNVLNNISNNVITEILSRWSLIQYEKNFDYQMLSQYLLIFLAILLVFIYWMIKLKIEVNRRKEVENQLKELNDKLEQRVLEEIEKNRQQQFTMFQQSRLAQMGEMISMIAHQWRQPLNAISSASTSIESKTMLNKIEKEFILDKCSKISDYVNYLSSTIEDFRNFFRPEKEKTTTTLIEVVDDALNIIEESLLEKKITIKKEYQSRATLNIYANEVKQVVLNLIKNAEDIFQEKKIKQPIVTIKTYDEIQYTILEISDNGGGITPEYLHTIFDPYFSTKNEKSGTGLGLYMSKTIIEDHCKGFIHVENVDEGARFTIKIPVK